MTLTGSDAWNIGRRSRVLGSKTLAKPGLVGPPCFAERQDRISGLRNVLSKASRSERLTTEISPIGFYPSVLEVSNVKKISERNCIDLVQKLIDLDQVKLFHTASGKEPRPAGQLKQVAQLIVHTDLHPLISLFAKRTKFGWLGDLAGPSPKENLRK